MAEKDAEDKLWRKASYRQFLNDDTEEAAAPMRFLFEVADAFEIEGRGCVLIPGIPKPSNTMRSVKRNEPIELRKPDGSVSRTSVWTIEMIHTRQTTDHIAILIPNFSKADIPLKSEVWLVND